MQKYFLPQEGQCFVTFDVDSKARSDEDIISESNYVFNLDINELLNNSENTRLAERNRKKGIKKIPRPQNAFIIYRRNKCIELRSTLEGKNQKSKDLSKKIAQEWNKEPRQIRELFEALARVSEKIHVEKYKNYKYCPDRSKSRRSISKLSSSKSKPKSPKSSRSKTSDSESKLKFKLFDPKSVESKPSEPKSTEPKFLEPKPVEHIKSFEPKPPFEHKSFEPKPPFEYKSFDHKPPFEPTSFDHKPPFEHKSFESLNYQDVVIKMEPPDIKIPSY
ncbi:mating type protein MAT1-1-3 [Rhizophagus clarus]|nr:mating type protein MAT1-1-3 [Rhizophagus clarus]